MGIPLPREREFERGILVWIWDRRDVWVGLKPTERLQASRGRRQGRRTRRTKTLSEVNGEVRLKKRLTQPTLLEMSGLGVYQSKRAVTSAWQRGKSVPLSRRHFMDKINADCDFTASGT